MPWIFHDRRDAGRRLAVKLRSYARRPDTIVLGLPRGGVPVAAEVAHALGLPLDVFVVRKLGVPGYEELAMGAIATGGVRVLNHDLIDQLRIPPSIVDGVTVAQRRELARREQAFRGDRPAPGVRGKTVIVVDDGLATGSSMQAAVAALREEGPASIVVAAPVGAPETCAVLKGMADDCICVMTPVPFRGVGLWYTDFTQTGDAEVRAILDEAARGPAPAAAGA